MNIRITGRTGDVTGAMKRKAQDKVGKLVRYYDRLTWVNVVLDVDPPRNHVEINVGLNRGNTLTVRSENEDMYAAIDLAMDKVSRQIRRHKDKLRDHRPKKSEAPPSAGSDDEAEPTFEEAIEDI